LTQRQHSRPRPYLNLKLAAIPLTSPICVALCRKIWGASKGFCAHVASITWSPCSDCDESRTLATVTGSISDTLRASSSKDPCSQLFSVQHCDSSSGRDGHHIRRTRALSWTPLECADMYNISAARLWKLPQYTVVTGGVCTLDDTSLDSRAWNKLVLEFV
jgi:hypothetical protein